MCLSLLKWNRTSIWLQFWTPNSEQHLFSYILEAQHKMWFRICIFERYEVRSWKSLLNSCLLVSQKFHATFTFQAFKKFSNWKKKEQKKIAHIEEMIHENL